VFRRCRQVIVKEKLVFPSGTATAQIISVLHDVPPPGGARKRRGGYRALATSDGEVGEEDDMGKGEKIDQKGWMVLLTSFAVSAGFTVSCIWVAGAKAGADACECSF
jgi:uncharacterized oligopeptide transporter (OPT) family protein